MPKQGEFDRPLCQFRLHRWGWGVVRWEWGVGKCRTIDLDLIIPMQPETMLLTPW